MFDFGKPELELAIVVTLHRPAKAAKDHHSRLPMPQGL
jgi:hypothetical protein